MEKIAVWSLFFLLHMNVWVEKSIFFVDTVIVKIDSHNKQGRKYYV